MVPKTQFGQSMYVRNVPNFYESERLGINVAK